MSKYVSATGEQLLFDPLLVPESLVSVLPEDVVARPLARNDHTRGFVQVLATLTKAPVLSPEIFEAQFDALASRPSTYFCIVFEHVPTGKVIACATLIVELKFIRSAGKVGHIEDVVVDPAFKGRNFGRLLINALSAVGEAQGCYKVILDCDPKSAGFYEKCGYHNTSIQMALYF